MKFRSTSSDSRVRSLRLLLALACLLPLLALAAPPGWWTDRQVLDPNAAKSDFGSVNQGQLKNMAKKAYAELRNALPSEIWTTPQGQALAALVDSWNPAQPGNFDLINQGQLKAVAKKFYDVLILHGYTDAYPWTGATTAAANDALANLGQLKNLFSFDLPRDSDGGGISDGLETKSLQWSNKSDAAATATSATAFDWCSQRLAGLDKNRALRRSGPVWFGFHLFLCTLRCLCESVLLERRLGRFQHPCWQPVCHR